MRHIISRGIRNNNPFNIRYSVRNNWVGKVVSGRTDKEFEQFEFMHYGLRAGMKLIAGYLKRSKGKEPLSLKDVIYRFAPETENNSSAYFRFVLEELSRRGVVWNGKPYERPFYEFCSVICLYESRYHVSWLKLRSIARRYFLY